MRHSLKINPLILDAAKQQRPLLIEMAAANDDYEDRRLFSLVGGICVIDIAGLLSNVAWPFGSTYGAIRAELARAIAWPECRGVLLRVNSPGGECDNAFETADAIAAAGKVKPVWAVAAVNCYSAAYLLASAAEKVFVASTSGGVGSVGIVCAHVDYSGLLEKEGVVVSLLSAGNGKTDANPYEPLSTGARAKLQAEVDRLYEVFVAAVARYRHKRADTVRELGARMFNGSAAAIRAGLADAAGTFETVLAAFQKSLDPADQIFSASAAADAIPETEGETKMQTMMTAPATTSPENSPLLRAVRKFGESGARPDGHETEERARRAADGPLLRAVDALVKQAKSAGAFD